ncbi:Restriction endonuclease, type II, Tsp45I [Candidatus Magnetoovum chiemensis]|nr:Restriction endonuclease, type II, Tsp45I [Candidatus Magnetoovum chiemensis]
MNHWINLSIDYANQRSYLDDLFQVYPTIPEGIRDIDNNLWKQVEKAFEKKDNFELLESILKLDLFPNRLCQMKIHMQSVTGERFVLPIFYGLIGNKICPDNAGGVSFIIAFIHFISYCIILYYYTLFGLNYVSI